MIHKTYCFFIFITFFLILYQKWQLLAPKNPKRQFDPPKITLREESVCRKELLQFVEMNPFCGKNFCACQTRVIFFEAALQTRLRFKQMLYQTGVNFYKQALCRKNFSCNN